MAYAHRTIRAGLCAALGWCGFALADPLPADQSSAAMDGWVTQLSSDDWKTRQRAMEKLVNLGEDALPRLKVLAESASDGEVRTRASAAVVQIEENRVIGATLVTMNLHEVTPAQAFEEIARIAKSPLLTDPPHLLTQKFSKPVSLKFDHEPLWKVLQSFSAQTELEVTDVVQRNREMHLGVTRGNADWQDRPIVLSGPLLIRADRLSRINTLPLKGGNPVEEFNISLTVFAEPKLKIMDYSGTLKLEEVVDERGNSLIPPQLAGAVAPNAEGFGNLREGSSSHWEVGATLHYPKEAGKKIAHLKAAAALQVRMRSAVLDIPLAGARNVARTLDGVRVMVKAVDASHLELSITRDGRSDAEWYALRMQLSACEACLKDEKGQVVARNQRGMEQDETRENQQLELKIRFARELFDDGTTSKESKKAGISEATRLVWEFPTEVRELSVPFEFRDLPIP